MQQHRPLEALELRGRGLVAARLVPVDGKDRVAHDEPPKGGTALCHALIAETDTAALRAMPVDPASGAIMRPAEYRPRIVEVEEGETEDDELHVVCARAKELKLKVERGIPIFIRGRLRVPDYPLLV